MSARQIADAFVAARHEARALSAYPGELPQDMAAAYAIQDAAIGQWPDQIAGWKVGWVPEPHATKYGENRLVGPIFATSVRTARRGEVTAMSGFEGGFCAVEAEYVLELARDAGPRSDWDEHSAAALVGSLRYGIEIASSPLAAINDLGPAVTASDFGNNAGLLVGPQLTDWREAMQRGAPVECLIDGKSIGTGGPGSIAGGPLVALAFALNRNARRGRPLRTGDLVSTGATTGVHRIHPGQSAVARFGGAAEIACRIVSAQPRPVVGE